MRFGFIILVFGTFLLKNVSSQTPFMLGNVLERGNGSKQNFLLQQSSSDMNKLLAQNIVQVIANRLNSIVLSINDLFNQFNLINMLMSMDMTTLNMTLYNMTMVNSSMFTTPPPKGANMSTMPPLPSPPPIANSTILSFLMNMTMMGNFTFGMGNMTIGNLTTLNLTNETIAGMNDLRKFIISLVNQTSRFENITDVVRFMNKLNDTLFMRLQSLPPILQPIVVQFQFTDLDPNMYIDASNMNMINLNNYMPNITDTVKFWNDFSQRSPALIGVLNDMNATDLDMIGFMSLFEVPQSDNAKANFMAKLNQTLMMNSTNFKNLIGSIQTNGTINSSVILAIKPVLGSLSCLVLRKIDFSEMKMNIFDINMTMNVQDFQRLLMCNPHFMISALSNYQMAPSTLDSVLRSALVSTYTDFLKVLPLGNFFDSVVSLGPLIRDVPSGKIDDIMSKLDMNQTVLLMKMVNISDMYPTLPGDARAILAKYISKYLISIANTSWVSNDIMLFNTTIFDIPISQFQNILMMNATFKKLFTVLDMISQNKWSVKCDTALSYYSLLLKTLKLTNDSMITLDRLTPMLMCKKDCDFSDLQPLYAMNATYFARTVIQALKPEIAPMCRPTVGRLLRPDNMSNITDSFLKSLAPIPLSAIFSASELMNLNPASVVSSLVNTTVDRSVAQKFRDITANKSIADAGSLIVGQSLDYFLNKSSSEVKSSIDTITKYIPQLSSPIKLDLIKKCLNNSTKSDFLSFSNNIDPDTAKLVPLSKCKDANITLSDLLANPYVVLSDACRKYIAKNVMQNNTLSSFNATTVTSLAAIISVLPPSAFQNLPLDTAIALISGPQQGNVDASIRRNVYNAIKNASMTTIGPLPSQYLAIFTDSIVKQLGGEIFMELSDDELKVFSKMPVFMSVINLVSQIPRNKCCSFVRAARLRFAMYAIEAMGKTGMTLTSADLDTLGQFLVSSFSVSLIGLIDLQSLSDRISYFQGYCFQLNKADSAAFGQILSNLTTLPTYASNKDLLMLNLGDLIYFYPDFTSVNWTSFDNVQNNVKTVRTVRSNMASTKVQCRSEFNKIDGSDMNDRVKRLDNLVLTLFQQRKASGYTMRKRRQALSTTYTCSDIRTLGDSIGQWNSSQILLIQPPSDFLNCLSDLGATTKNWTTASLATLAGLYKTYANISASNITDTVIGQLGLINAGFNASELSQFQINSFDTVSVLGGITLWDSTQASALASVIKNTFGLSSSTLVAMSNLVGGLSPNDIGNITVGDFMDAVPIISGVTTANMTPWFQLAQKAYSSDILSPENIIILGSVMGGMNKTQLANLSTDAINSLSPAAFLAFSSDTLSVLSPTQLSALSRLQAQTILTSPIADSLPTAFTTQIAVRDLASDTTNTTTTTTASATTTTITTVSTGSTTTTKTSTSTTTTKSNSSRPTTTWILQLILIISTIYSTLFN